MTTQVNSTVLGTLGNLTITNDVRIGGNTLFTGGAYKTLSVGGTSGGGWLQFLTNGSVGPYIYNATQNLVLWTGLSGESKIVLENAVHKSIEITSANVNIVSGNVRVNGNLTVTGIVNGIIQGISNPNIQTFDVSGTWTKPTNVSMARIQCWGAGGGGGRNSVGEACGGGGGGYNEITVPISQLLSSVSITVGIGGAGRTGSNGAGEIGGNTTLTVNGVTFGAYGGGGGYQQGGAGGGTASAATNGFPGSPGNPQINTPNGTMGAGETVGDGGTVPVFGIYHGGGGGYYQGGDTIYGGGGGCAQSSSPGVSMFGGNGGVNSVGTAPGGGGGSNPGVANGYAGAAGRCIITCW